ncbi:MAG: biotin transporter BioY [Solirubrobacterales bacterium]
MQLTTRQITFAALFTALLAAAGLLSRFLPMIPGTTIPFSLQPLVVYLAGTVLEKRIAVLSLLAYILLGLIGVPVFAAPPYGGPLYIFVPTFGFLLGFLLAAWVMAWIFETKQPGLATYIIAGLAGVSLVYLVGLPYLYVILNFYLGKSMAVLAVIKIAFIPFVGTDLIKAAAAIYVGMILRQSLGMKNTPIG